MSKTYDIVYKDVTIEFDFEGTVERVYMYCQAMGDLEVDITDCFEPSEKVRAAIQDYLNELEWDRKDAREVFGEIFG